MCGFESGPQDNWIITQFINNTLRREFVYISVIFSINRYECTANTSCLSTLNVHVLQTNEVDQNFVRNVSVFDRSSAFVLTSSIGDGTNLITHTIRISADLSTSGFYVAFRDRGTCIGILEVLVYYPVCDSISLDFGASFLTTQFPGGSSVGSCFANMSVALNPTNRSFEATCTLSTSSNNESLANWTINGDPSGCMCLPGYMFISRSSTEQCKGMNIS